MNDCKHGMACCEPCAYDRGRIDALREARDSIDALPTTTGDCEDYANAVLEWIDGMVAVLQPNICREP
jgi:hypothetical protein